ncbi:MAG: metallophosphoesterase [Clostridia bacterium]|nr:metallophosphoesterase [Clostridia bacterium]
MVSKETWLLLILIVVSTFTFVTLFGDMSFNIKGLELRLSLEIFDNGLTEINIPPVGIISAKTHQTPIKLGITLTNIDIDLMRQLIEEPIDQAELVEMIIQEIRWSVGVFIARMLLVAFIGGAFAMLLLHRKDMFDYLKAALMGFAIMAVLLTGTFYTYNINEFSNPQYRGIIKAAPWMIGFAQDAFAKVDQLGEQMRLTADNLYELFEKVDLVRPIGEFADTIKILHVSDIHNNPAAYDFIQQVSESFQVDLIIDSGDISDFGSPLEALLLERLNDFTLPYLFVAGNHDSPEIISAMELIDNVIVINDEIVNVKGFNIMGLHDPASVSTILVPPNEDTVFDYIQKAEVILKEADTIPDIFVVHHPHIAMAFANKIPVILHGHRHRVTIITEEESVIIDSGTTGAAGIRGLQSKTEVPYSVVLLHFIWKEDEEKNVLRAADVIKIYDLEGGFIIQRTIFD